MALATSRAASSVSGAPVSSSKRPSIDMLLQYAATDASRNRRPTDLLYLSATEHVDTPVAGRAHDGR
eukprot:COSAG02_NODE_553_length_20425_cov_17.986372_14_plen_67_part_00